MKNNRTSSLSVGIKSASSEGGSEESGSQSTQGGGQGQGGEKRRPVNISFLSYFFFFFARDEFSLFLGLVPVVGTGSSLSLHSGHNLKKSLTEHMTGVAAGPPLSLFSPWGPWGEPVLPFGTGWVRGPTYRQSLQQSWFALQRHHTALPQRFWKTYTQLERIAWNCKRNRSEGKRKGQRERVEGRTDSYIDTTSSGRFFKTCEYV